MPPKPTSAAKPPYPATQKAAVPAKPPVKGKVPPKVPPVSLKASMARRLGK